MARTNGSPHEERARTRAHSYTGLMWHIGAFVILNALVWLPDLALEQSGAQWAGWITAAWGFALAFHALAYIIDGRGVEERKAKQFLSDEQRHHPARR